LSLLLPLSLLLLYLAERRSLAKGQEFVKGMLVQVLPLLLVFMTFGRST